MACLLFFFPATEIILLPVAIALIIGTSMYLMDIQGDPIWWNVYARDAPHGPDGDQGPAFSLW